jgi:predicted Fe-S protein YdhL (DUF1289 family)/uncharacterized protein (DUF433 family)
LIDSPCNKVCVVDPDSRLCRGCYRTLDEIARWGDMSKREREGVMGQLRSRRAAPNRMDEPGVSWPSQTSKDDDMKQDVIRSDPEIQGGVPVFAGTRVPVKYLFDSLEAGDSLDAFLKSFPSVTREQAIAALELAREALEPDAHPA